VKDTDTIQEAEKALMGCLESPPFIQAVRFDERERSEGSYRPDLVARITTPDGEKIVFIEVKNNGQPRYARQAINELTLYAQSSPDSYEVFIAPYISPSSARMLKEAGIGYVDFAGNCLLNFEKVFINIEGKPNPFPKSRELRTLFSPRASRIIRVLLADPFVAWKVDEVSKKAEVSLGLVATVKKILLDREWIMERNVGFALIKPEELLQEWVSQYTYRKNRISNLYSIKDESAIEQELKEYCSVNNIRYALTLFSGASRVAPYARYKGVYAYIEDGSKETMLQQALGLKQVATGPNVTFLVPYDEGVFYGLMKYNEMPVVSPIQLYLDLKSYKGRGEDAAQFLFEQVIGPSWLQKQTTEKER
jgi:hypothetical protein